MLLRETSRSNRWPRQLVLLLTAMLALEGTGSAHQDDRGPARLAPGPSFLEPIATFSIVAYDPATGDLGVAVQSKFFAVGAVVPWARAGVGAVATQSLANTAYGPDGLAMLAEGDDAATVVAALTSADDRRDQRQLGIVDAQGRVASFTGEACLAWAGAAQGEHWTAQGNILAGPEVVEAMGAAFEATDGDLATRLAAALAAGQAAGGDARGRQSAALLVVREGGGYGGNDRYIDLRVDDHPTPIVELRRLLDLRHAQTAGRNAALAMRDEDLDRALAAAERATRLDPASGIGWLTLAAVRLRRGEREQAAAAGREALLREPWIKAAMLRGGPFARTRDVIESLLEIESFARVWESIPAPR